MIKQLSADLDVLRFPAPVEHPIETECLNCSLPLSLSKLDLDSPERLLGVCERCKHWFLIDLIANQTEGLLLQLPEREGGDPTTHFRESVRGFLQNGP